MFHIRQQLGLSRVIKVSSGPKLDEWRTWLIFILLILFFLNTFFPFSNGEIILAILSFVITLSFFPKTKGIPKFFSIFMLITGSIILLTKDTSVQEWAHSYIKNLPLVALIILTPILAIPITLGGYDNSIERITNRYRNKPGLMYFAITLIFFMISSVLNLGSVRLIHTMLNKLQLPKEFLGRVYMRGFTSVIGWSPYFASVLLILDFVDISFSAYLPYGLIFGVTHLLLGNLFYWVDCRKIDFPKLESGENKKEWKLIELPVFFVLMTIAIFILENYLHTKMMILVSVTILFFPLLWSLYLHSLKGFFKSFENYRKSIVPASSNEFVLFITSGFFGMVLADTVIGEVLNKGLVYIANYSILLVIFITISIAVFLSIVGIHHIVTLTAIASSVAAADLGLENVVFALTLISPWTISTIISPVTPGNVILTNLLNGKYTDVIRWNGLFAFASLVVHTLLIYTIHLIIS